jgi:hypothetical protein
MSAAPAEPDLAPAPHTLNSVCEGSVGGTHGLKGRLLGLEGQVQSLESLRQRMRSQLSGVNSISNNPNHESGIEHDMDAAAPEAAASKTPPAPPHLPAPCNEGTDASSISIAMQRNEPRQLEAGIEVAYQSQLAGMLTSVDALQAAVGQQHALLADLDGAVSRLEAADSASSARLESLKAEMERGVQGALHAMQVCVCARACVHACMHAWGRGVG